MTRPWVGVAVALAGALALGAYVGRPSRRPTLWKTPDKTFVDSQIPEFFEKRGIPSRIVGDRWVFRVGASDVSLVAVEPGLADARGTTYEVTPADGLDFLLAFKLAVTA